MAAPQQTPGGINPHPQRIKKSIMKRVSVLYVVFAVFAVLIFGMTLLIQYGPNGRPLRNLSDETCYRTITIEPSRGNIYSRDYQILATDSPDYNIFLDFAIPRDSVYKALHKPLADSLSVLFPEYPKNYFYNKLDEIRKKATNGTPGGRNQRLIPRKATQLELDRMLHFPLFDETPLRGGLIYKRVDERFKPYDNLAARTIGRPYRADRPDEQSYGLEASFDQYLAGTPGRSRQVRLFKREWVPVIDKLNLDVKNGNDLTTTIDVRMQDIVETELRKQISVNNALSGTAIVMDVATGEVRAVSNLRRGASGEILDDINYAITLRAEPGSTFKLVSLMALLDDAHWDTETMIYCEDGTYHHRPGNKWAVRDSHKVQWANIQQIMEESSNIGFVKAVTSVYESQPERFVDYIYGLGINRPLSMQLLGGRAPWIKDPRNAKATGWDGMSIMKMSYGYAIELTPLHTLTLYNAIANNGVMVAPRLVTEVRSQNGSTLERYPVEVINPKICSDSTLAFVQRCLEGVVERGTATALRNDRYRIAGKTGTAQMPKHNQGYGQDGSMDYLATFVGYFPADNPQYTCIVAIQTQRRYGSNTAYYASSLAVPAFKSIADKIYAIDKHWQSPVEQRIYADTIPVKGGSINEIYRAGNELNIATNLRKRDNGCGMALPDSAKLRVVAIPDEIGMPSVVGMGLKDALFILERKGLEVTATGTGKVVSQSIKEGAAIKEGQSVKITLRPNDKPTRRR